MKIVGIIPARMGSSRFPGKPLALIFGKPMIEHVYKRSAMSKSLDDLYIATCDEVIYKKVVEFGGKAIMTSDCHERCTDRVAEAADNIDADIYVIIQGDEPMIFPEMVDQALQPLIEDDTILCSNLMAEIKTEREFEDANEVKVVVDLNNFALYFSREAIPSKKKCTNNVKGLKQVCIMPFRKSFLSDYTKLTPTPLEIIESVDMLRAIEHGYKIKMVKTEYETYSVDTMDDLNHVETIMKTDELFKKYN